MIARIAIVHTDFRLYWPSRLRSLSDFLARKGITLFVVEVSGQGSPYSFAGGSVDDSGIAWTRIFRDQRMEEIDAAEAVRAVCDKLDDLAPDVVISGPIAFPSGAASTRWCTRNGKPLVVFDDARLDDVPRPWYIDWIKKQVYSQVDAMVIPAASHDSTYRYFGLGQQQLFYGVNVIDNHFFASPDAAAAPCLPDFFKASRCLLCVGRQIPKKNWKQLLEAFRNIAGHTEASGWSMVFIGDGTEHEALLGIAGDLLDQRVHFLPFKTQEELVYYYHAAAALVLPSLYGETWGLVVNEAMASGIPVLVSRKCGSSETLVQDGVNGFLFDPDNIRSIEQTLLTFFSLDVDSRVDMGNASRRLIDDWGLERFCQGMWDAVAFAQSHGKRKGTLAGRNIVNYWNGRYCPT